MARKTQSSDTRHHQKEAAKGERNSEQESVSDRAIAACLSLAAEEGWDRVTLSGIAERAGMPLGVLYGVYDDRSAILAAWARRIDRLVLNAASSPDSNVPVRERLFDILMDRFDRLQADRAGAVAILSALRRDPKQAVIALPHLARSMAWMLEAAGIETNGWRGAARIAGLTALWLRISMIWAQDESEDLGRTMATLDQALDRAGQAAEFLERFDRSGRSGPQDSRQ